MAGQSIVLVLFCIFIYRNDRIYKHTLLLKETKRLTGIFKLHFDRKVVTHVFSLAKKQFITLIA